MVKTDFYDLCLSSCRQGLKPEINKPVIYETTESLVFLSLLLLLISLWLYSIYIYIYTSLCFDPFWSISPSPSLVHFMNISEYITTRTAWVLILLMRFLLKIFVSRSFIVRLRYFINIFLISDSLIIPASNSPKSSQVSVSPIVLMISWFGSYNPSVISLSPILIISMANFSMPIFIPITWLHNFFFCILVPSFFFIIPSKELDVIHVYKLIDLFLWLCKFVTASSLLPYATKWYHYYYKKW